MMKKKKGFKMPKRRQPVFSFFKKIFFGPIYRAKVESLSGELPSKAILVSNHAAKKGPMAYEVSYPHFNVKWGAHEMLGGYKSRYKYLRNVLYIQKLGKGKVYATLKAAFEAIFSIYVYRGMKFIPTYTDIRFAKSIRYSIEVLDSDATVTIFPEDSNKGYFDELTEVFPGFVMLAQSYLKRRGEDVPVIPSYYSKKHKKIIVGEPRYIGQLMEQGMTNEQITELFKDDINSLYRTYFKD